MKWCAIFIAPITRYDTYPSIETHRKYTWGVKSAVMTFAAEVDSPFFLTFADHAHKSGAKDPFDMGEFASKHKGVHPGAPTDATFARSHRLVPSADR